MAKVCIDIANLTKTFGARKLLDGINYKIYAGEKMGLIGPNGTGKTTLIKAILGLEEVDSGNIVVKGNVGYLPQFPVFKEGMTIKQYFESHGIDLEEATSLMGKLYMDKGVFEKGLDVLSGGEKTKVILAVELSKSPDILILDEPTNHLDVDSIEWLEGCLKNFKGTVLTVSHDRYFLDKVVHKILEIDDGKLIEYKGNYSFYVHQKKQKFQRQLFEYQQYKKEKKRLEEMARKALERSQNMERKSWHPESSEERGGRDFYGGKAKKVARTAKAMAKRLEHLEVKEAPKERDKINLSFVDRKDVNRYIFEAIDLSKSFGQKLLFSDANFVIEKGEKVALLGKNGCGKTTLLKIFIGEEAPSSGSIKVAENVKIGYFAQQLEVLDFEKTVLENVLDTGAPQAQARNFLSCLLFRGDDVNKKVVDLSVGEKARLVFAKLLLSDINVLVLDEPTNHLDIESKEAIEDALEAFDGTILFVTHDRYFIKRLASKVIEIDNQRVKVYDGGYEYYVQKKADTGRVDIKQQILLLENRLAQLSGLLSDPKRSTDVDELNKEFIEISRKLRDLYANNKR